MEHLEKSGVGLSKYELLLSVVAVASVWVAATVIGMSAWGLYGDIKALPPTPPAKIADMAGAAKRLGAAYPGIKVTGEAKTLTLTAANPQDFQVWRAAVASAEHAAGSSLKVKTLCAAGYSAAAKCEGKVAALAVLEVPRVP